MHRESFNLKLWVKTGLYRSVYSRVEWEAGYFSLVLVDRETETPIAKATIRTPDIVFEQGDILRVWSGNRVRTHTVDEPPQAPIRFDFYERDLVPVEVPPG